MTKFCASFLIPLCHNASVNFTSLLAISRPRFWIYLLGPFLLGILAGTPSLSQLWQFRTIVVGLFFVFPANLFLYGINDWYDRDTDQLNSKKQTHEHLLHDQERVRLKQALIACCGCAALLFLLLTGVARWSLGLFLFLSWAYSAPPFRFKARPFFDSFSNVLYFLPALIGFGVFSNTLPPLFIVLAAIFWTAGMHAFSALPDIAPDAKAGIQTIAVFLGRKLGLQFVILSWFLTAFLSTWELGVWAILLWIYPVIPVLLLKKSRQTLEKWYWYFPFLNTAVGGVLFWLLVFSRWNTL